MPGIYRGYRGIGKGNLRKARKAADQKLRDFGIDPPKSATEAFLDEEDPPESSSEHDKLRIRRGERLRR